MTVALTILFFIAPGASSIAEGRWVRGAALFVLNLAGMLAAALLVTRFDTFPLAAVVLWLVYQGVLTVTFGLQERQRRSNQRRVAVAGMLAAALCLSPPILAGFLVADGISIMRVENSPTGPLLQPGDWVSYRRVTTSSPLRPGDLVVVRCNDAPGSRVARVMGVPGDEVWREKGRVCTTTGCYPVKRMGDFKSGGDSGAAAVEVLNDNYHVIVHSGGSSPATAGMALWLGDGEFALLPDNRGDQKGSSCRRGLVARRDEIQGIPTWVLFSPEVERIGLAIK